MVGKKCISVKIKKAKHYLKAKKLKKREVLIMEAKEETDVISTEMKHLKLCAVVPRFA